MVIRHLSCAAHEKVGSNQPRGPGKLSFTTFDLPDHGPVLQSGVRTRANVPLPDCAEVKAVLVVAERDGAFFLKGRLTSEGHLRLKAALTAGCGLKVATNAGGSHHGGIVQLGAVVVALSTVPASLAGTARPLNCIVYRICCATSPPFW